MLGTDGHLLTSKENWCFDNEILITCHLPANDGEQQDHLSEEKCILDNFEGSDDLGSQSKLDIKYRKGISEFKFFISPVRFWLFAEILAGNYMFIKLFHFLRRPAHNTQVAIL